MPHIFGAGSSRTRKDSMKTKAQLFAEEYASHVHSWFLQHGLIAESGNMLMAKGTLEAYLELAFVAGSLSRMFPSE